MFCFSSLDMGSFRAFNMFDGPDLKLLFSECSSGFLQAQFLLIYFVFLYGPSFCAWLTIFKKWTFKIT